MVIAGKYTEKKLCNQQVLLALQDELVYNDENGVSMRKLEKGQKWR